MLKAVNTKQLDYINPYEVLVEHVTTICHVRSVHKRYNYVYLYFF